MELKFKIDKVRFLIEKGIIFHNEENIIRLNSYFSNYIVRNIFKAFLDNPNRKFCLTELYEYFNRISADDFLLKVKVINSVGIRNAPSFLKTFYYHFSRFNPLEIRRKGSLLGKGMFMVYVHKLAPTFLNVGSKLEHAFAEKGTDYPLNIYLTGDGKRCLELLREIFDNEMKEIKECLRKMGIKEEKVITDNENR